MLGSWVRTPSGSPKKVFNNEDLFFLKTLADSDVQSVTHSFGISGFSEAADFIAYHSLYRDFPEIPFKGSDYLKNSVLCTSVPSPVLQGMFTCVHSALHRCGTKCTPVRDFFTFPPACRLKAICMLSYCQSESLNP